MRLINPTPGECVDRQTICLIKVERGTAAKIDNVHLFGEECNEIQLYLEKHYLFELQRAPGKPAAFDADFNELKQTNERLWDLENKIRDYKKRNAAKRLLVDDLMKIAEVAFLIAELNDHRAELVRKINALFSIAGREKMYV